MDQVLAVARALLQGPGMTKWLVLLGVASGCSLYRGGGTDDDQCIDNGAAYPGPPRSFAIR